jgi:hypothetical protein
MDLLYYLVRFSRFALRLISCEDTGGRGRKIARGMLVRARGAADGNRP